MGTLGTCHEGWGVAGPGVPVWALRGSRSIRGRARRRRVARGALGRGPQAGLAVSPPRKGSGHGRAWGCPGKDMREGWDIPAVPGRGCGTGIPASSPWRDPAGQGTASMPRAGHSIHAPDRAQHGPRSPCIPRALSLLHLAVCPLVVCPARCPLVAAVALQPSPVVTWFVTEGPQFGVQTPTPRCPQHNAVHGGNYRSSSLPGRVYNNQNVFQPLPGTEGQECGWDSCREGVLGVLFGQV